MFAPASSRTRLTIFVLWAAIVLFLAVNHVPWRDEARGFALATQGDTWRQMIRGVQGEGHPILWYVWLRALHDMMGVKEALTVGGVLIAVAYAALFAWKAPFRPLLLLLVLLSQFMVLDFAVVARNYGMVALVLFAIAALWTRIRDSLWLGLLLFVLCNTAVPAVYLAGGILLYRMLELWRGRAEAERRQWLVFVGNGLLLLLGALACFVTVYPTVNDAAAYATREQPTAMRVLKALFWNKRSFHDMGMTKYGAIFVVLAAVLVFRRQWPALVAALVVLVLLRFQYYFIYPGYYRHSAIYLAFLLSLAWIVHQERKAAGLVVGDGVARRWVDWLALLAFIGIFAVQSFNSVRPMRKTLEGVPYSPAKKVAELIASDPTLTGATVMAEPDTWGESVAYQLGRPVWLMRQQRLGMISPLTMKGRKFVTLDDILSDSETLHRTTGRKVVILLWLREEQWAAGGTYDKAFGDYLHINQASSRLFFARTRREAQFRKAQTDERYDVFVYPR